MGLPWGCGCPSLTGHARGLLTSLVTLLLLQLGSAQLRVEGPGQLLTATVGQDVVLPCHLSPRRDARSLEVRWIRRTVSETVHHYHNGEDVYGEQMGAYAGRTELARDGLSAGSLDLRITGLRPSDEGRYVCIVKDGDAYDEATVDLEVSATGTDPHLSLGGYEAGGIQVLCRSAGWYPLPQLLWRDARGQHLPSVSQTHSQDQEGLFEIEGTIIVTGSVEGPLSCVVRSSRIQQERESSLHITAPFFHNAQPWKVALALVLVLLAVSIGLAVYLFRKKVAQSQERGESLQSLPPVPGEVVSLWEGLGWVGCGGLCAGGSGVLEEQLEPDGGFSFPLNKGAKLGKSAFINLKSSHKQQSDEKFSLLILLCFCFPFPAEQAAEQDEYSANAAEQSTRLEEQAAELVRKDRELEQQAVELAQKDSRLAQKDARLVELSAELVEKDASLVHQSARLKEQAAELLKKDAKIKEQAAGLVKKDAEFAEQAAELAWRKFLIPQNPVKVTLDPRTAHPQLALSQDYRSVRWESELQKVHNTRERFDNRCCVLGREEFREGKHCWLVEVVGERGKHHSWAVGVARASVKRKGEINMSPEGGIWAVQYNEGQLMSLTSPPTPLSLSAVPMRIWVCLDCTQGQVSFISADNGVEIFTFTAASLKGENIRPWLWLGTNAQLCLRNSTPQTLSPVLEGSCPSPGTPGSPLPGPAEAAQK
ncbi:butyrophilin subfamily 3 member A1-like [Anser cygnoides]|uniref:butyrophilin subfamily 3 member A1-like n=1 Tax=Anser cygnoides TaxID=8845 RepID=UPI0034D36FE9